VIRSGLEEHRHSILRAEVHHCGEGFLRDVAVHRHDATGRDGRGEGLLYVLGGDLREDGHVGDADAEVAVVVVDRVVDRRAMSSLDARRGALCALGRRFTAQHFHQRHVDPRVTATVHQAASVDIVRHSRGKRHFSPQPGEGLGDVSSHPAVGDTQPAGVTRVQLRQGGDMSDEVHHRAAHDDYLGLCVRGTVRARRAGTICECGGWSGCDAGGRSCRDSCLRWGLGLWGAISRGVRHDRGCS
jgi:hypothetical protein